MNEVHLEHFSGAVAEVLISDEISHTSFYQSLTAEQQARFGQCAHNLILIGMQTVSDLLGNPVYISPEEQLLREADSYRQGVVDDYERSMEEPEY